MFPISIATSSLIARLPHARGGVSSYTASCEIFVASSPRPWECFLFDHKFWQDTAVFPTPVGVFLSA
ncbi:conserved hypothetical protein [methanotrophic bacterial endosymbiont of Bathymodiolus sp.]|nr:conserved hypothetical protein [methanotrophic bacterial endosymbiont of Bathymodiolus sp.]